MAGGPLPVTLEQVTTLDATGSGTVQLGVVPSGILWHILVTIDGPSGTKARLYSGHRLLGIGSASQSMGPIVCLPGERVTVTMAPPPGSTASPPPGAGAAVTAYASGHAYPECSSSGVEMAQRATVNELGLAQSIATAAPP